MPPFTLETHVPLFFLVGLALELAFDGGVCAITGSVVNNASIHNGKPLDVLFFWVALQQ